MNKTEIDTLRKYLEEAGNLEFEDAKKITSEFGEIEFYNGVPAGLTVGYTPKGWGKEYTNKFPEYCSRISDAIKDLGYEGELKITENIFKDSNTKQINFIKKGTPIYAFEISKEKIWIHDEEGLNLISYII